MPAWLLAALGSLGGLVATKIGGGGIPFLPGPLDPFEPGGFDIFAGEDKKKRRRRRRALTQSDRNDIAFIAATISKEKAGAFAVQLATRSR